MDNTCTMKTELRSCHLCKCTAQNAETGGRVGSSCNPVNESDLQQSNGSVATNIFQPAWLKLRRKTAAWTVPWGALSKMSVRGRSPIKIVGSNPAGDIGACHLLVLCVVQQMSLRLADCSSSGVLPTVVHRCLLSRNPRMRGPWPAFGRSATGKTRN